MQYVVPYDVGSYNLSGVDIEIYDIFVFCALGSTESLAEMSTRNLPGGKGRPVH
jgi:hypothetical protein